MTLKGHSIKEFLVIECTGDKLPISIMEKSQIGLKKKTVIWSNGGLYRMIPDYLVEGLVTLYREHEKLPQLDTKKEARYVHWDNMVPLDAKVAKLLFK